MKNGIYVDNKVEKDTFENYAESVRKIFEAGFANHIDQNVIMHAINNLPDPGPVSINDCAIYGGDKK